jgi:pimeloyl-ACP methyl ester carboxylesterase
MEPLMLDSDGRRLMAMTFAPPSAGPDRPALLFVHGLGSDQVGYWEWAEAAADRLGATCLTFDLGGHGSSDGDLPSLSPADHLRDVLTAYDALVGQAGVDRHRVGICASSYGAYLAVLTTRERPVARLLLRAPGVYEDAALTLALRHRRKLADPTGAAQYFAALRSSTAPVLVVESGADDVIPASVIRGILAGCPRAQHATLAGAAHALTRPVDRADFLELMLGWFADM